MVVNDEIKSLAKEAPFVPISTVSSQGEQHLIVVGEVKEINDDQLTFGIYKMETTQENLEATGDMQVILASTKDEPKGYRLIGKGEAQDDKVLFKIAKAESLL
jgi:hypothetical protein